MILGASTHAIERAAERCLRPPTRNEWQAAILSILDQRAPMTRRSWSRPGQETYIVELGGGPVSVVWDSNKAIIVTVEPGFRLQRVERAKRGRTRTELGMDTRR
jgi:hypothetical protein